MVVISPLRSLMDDQVQYLCNQCILAIAITDDDDPETIQQRYYMELPRANYN